MVRRVAAHSDSDYPRHPHQQAAVPSEPRELATDHDFGRDHVSGRVVAVFVDRTVAGPRSAAAYLLAIVNTNSFGVRRPDPVGKGMAGSKRANLKASSAGR